MRRFVFLSIAILCFATKSFGQSLGRITLYLDSKQISQVAKDYYHGKFNASEDNRTFSILDSICTTNNATRPFYLLLVSRMMIKADGTLAEALGTYCKNFAEQHPNQIIAFLFAESGHRYQDGWAKAIAGELMIDCEYQSKTCSRTSFSIAAKKVKPFHKRSLEQFYEKITAYCR